MKIMCMKFHCLNFKNMPLFRITYHDKKEKHNRVYEVIAAGFTDAIEAVYNDVKEIEDYEDIISIVNIGHEHFEKRAVFPTSEKHLIVDTREFEHSIFIGIKDVQINEDNVPYSCISTASIATSNVKHLVVTMAASICNEDADYYKILSQITKRIKLMKTEA